MKLNELNWTVSKVQLQYEGINTGFYATKRDDNNKFLSTIGKNYPILQNHKLLDVCQELCNQTDYKLFMERALEGGKKVLLSLLCGQVKVGDDTINSQISVANSHTGTTSVAFSILDDTIRCDNRFSKIMNVAQFRFNHDSFVFEKLEEMVTKIALLNDYQVKHYDNLRSFVSTPLIKDLALKMLGNVLDIQVNENDVMLFDEDLSTRKKNQFLKMVDCYETESQDLGETLYTCYNTITNYTTHIIEQPYSGVGLKISNDIYNNCLQLI